MFFVGTGDEAGRCYFYVFHAFDFWFYNLLFIEPFFVKKFNAKISSKKQTENEKRMEGVSNLWKILFTLNSLDYQ